MSDRQDPESEERERLERFLKWRQPVGGNRGAPDRRSLFFVVGTVGLGVVAVVLIVTLMGRSLDTPRRLGGSSGLEPSDSVGGTETVAIERAPAAERPAMDPRRPARIEPGVPRRPMEPFEARALPQRPPPSQPPPLPRDLAQPSDGTTAASPPSPPLVPAPHDPLGTRGEAVGAAASSPTPTIATPSTPAVPAPDIAEDRRSETVETLKRLIGYIPEVRLGRAIVRWVKSQPPVDAGFRPLNPESPQAQ